MGPTGSQVVAFGDLDGTFRVLSLATGAQLYSYQTGNYMAAGIAETDGNLLRNRCRRLRLRLRTRWG